jgi:hypothetical protein
MSGGGGGGVVRCCTYFCVKANIHIFSIDRKFDRQEHEALGWVGGFMGTVRHVTGTGSGLLGGIPRVLVQISALL